MINKQTNNNSSKDDMSIIQNIISCMRGYRSNVYVSGKCIKIKFGVPLEKLSQKTSHHLPKPLFDLLVYLAQEGIKTNDLFRRPGNSNQMKKIVEMLSNGLEIEWSDYNLYTVASVLKKYFMNLPGGLFGRKFELMLLGTYSMFDDQRRMTFHRILHQLPNANRELAILMFGILFRMVSHYVDEYSASGSGNNRDKNNNNNNNNCINKGNNINDNIKNRPSDCNCTEFILAEAVAKSVAGSIFHLCTSSPENVEKAAMVLRGLILDFPSFDEEFVDFYYRSTLVSYGKFSDSEKQSQYPTNLTDWCSRPQYCEPPVVTITNPLGCEENTTPESSVVLKVKFPKHDCDNMSLKSTISSDCDKVQQRQLELMRLRSDWFLSAVSCNHINRKPLNSVDFCYYDESKEGSINLDTDSNLQFQIVATSGPDILQTLNQTKLQDAKASLTLTVPNKAEALSVHSYGFSSDGNTSTNSFVDEVYSDY